MNNPPPGQFHGSYDQPWGSPPEQHGQTTYGNTVNPGLHSPGQQWECEHDDFKQRIGSQYDYAQQQAFASLESRRWSSGPHIPRALVQHPGHPQTPTTEPAILNRGYHLTSDSVTAPHHNLPQQRNFNHGMHFTNLHNAHAFQGQMKPPIYDHSGQKFPNPHGSVSTGSVSGPLRTYPTVAQPGRTTEGNQIIQIHSSGPLIRESPQNQKTLDPDYKRIAKSKKFFAVGKVFMTPWSEPAGGNADDDTYTAVTSGFSGFSTGSLGEKVFSEIRRFVVVREGDQHCEALPICTYNRQGVSKNGVNKSEHAIIYTGRHVPTPLEEEIPQRGEHGLLEPAIRVDPDTPDQRLDRLSRVDFAKVYTIQHNIKVRSLGRVNRDSMEPLVSQFKFVWLKYFGDTGTKVQVQTRRRRGERDAEKGELSSRSKAITAYNALRACDFAPEQALAALGSAGAGFSIVELEEGYLDEGRILKITEHGERDYSDSGMAS